MKTGGWFPRVVLFMKGEKTLLCMSGWGGERKKEGRILALQLLDEQATANETEKELEI